MTQIKPFYTAKYDAVFKNAFCTDDRKEYLKKFIEKVLDIEIEDLILKVSEQEKKRVKLRSKTLDVLIKSKGKTINLEINNGYYKTLKMRNFSYLCSLISNSVFKGEKYKDTEEFVQLNITWGLGKKKKLIKQKYKVLSCYDKSEYVKNVTIYEINMDLLMEMWYSGNKKEALDNKYFLMLDLGPKELKEVCKGDELMEAYEKKVKELNADAIFIEVVDPKKDAEMQYNSIISEAKEEGMEKGLKKGLKEAKKQMLETAKKMIKNDLDINLISECTGLSVKQISTLSKE